MSGVVIARRAFAVTPHNTNNLPSVTTGLYIGTTGDVVVLLSKDTVAVTFKNVPAGTVLDVAAKKVLATGTTATNILGLI